MRDPFDVETVAVGLVGYGYWGPNLARNFARQPGCRLAAICDSDESRVAVARHHYPDARITSEYAALLDDDRIQAILVATPVSAHFELARLALEAGKDVLVEKPLAATEDQARELVRLAAWNFSG